MPTSDQHCAAVALQRSHHDPDEERDDDGRIPRVIAFQTPLTKRRR
jgi:hypothetical protein